MCSSSSRPPRKVDWISSAPDSMPAFIWENSSNATWSRSASHAEQRAAIVAAPSYFASHPKPKSPRDLPAHRCINFRHGSAGVYHWEFDKGRKSLSVAVNGPLTVDDVDVLIRAAVDGVGLAFALEEHVATQLANGDTDSGARRLVPAVCWVFPVLPEPPSAAASVVSAHRHIAPLRGSVVHRCGSGTAEFC